MKTGKKKKKPYGKKEQAKKIAAFILTCASVNLPAVKADFCNPNVNFGQIDKIYLGYPSNPMVDWTSLVEWNARLDNTTLADLTKIRYLHVIGDKPAAASNELKISVNRRIYTPKIHTVNIKVDETGSENYALLLWLEANVGQTLAVWYQCGKYLYGGNSGIPCTLTLDDVLPENNQELNTFAGKVVFEGESPARITNPMA